MEINRLNQEELGYELAIRGLPIGKVEEMRTSLRTALRAEKEGGSLIGIAYPFVFSQDKEVLDKKIVEIKALIEAFDGDHDSTDYKKISTKIQWALNRIGRAAVDGEEQKKEQIRIRGELVLCLGTLQTKADGKDDGSESSEASEEPCMSSTLLSSSRSRVPLYKWDIRFAGEHGQSLNSFLDRVQELADARGVNKEQLFRSALDLFTGRALIWYRANKKQFHSWNDLVRELKKEFLPVDYDDRLLEEIKKRTQGKDESMGMYTAIMSNMFSRLTDPLSEVQKLRILKKNISPFYQTQPDLTEIGSINDLIVFGRRLESVRASVEAFVPPPSRRNNQLLEPDLAYVSTEPPTVSAIANHNLRPQNAGPRRCFKCGNPGHIARFCRSTLRCFGCGTQGVIRPNCNKCNNSNNIRQDPSTSRQISQDSGNVSGDRI